MEISNNLRGLVKAALRRAGADGEEKQRGEEVLEGDKGGTMVILSAL